MCTSFFPGHNSCYHLFSPSVTSEDGCSVDLGFRVGIKEKGFYTENFHSSAWVFQGDDGNPEDSPRCLSKKPRPVAVRERTVKLVKGTGNYPWGFRIQFSKPIVVTEVDASKLSHYSSFNSDWGKPFQASHNILIASNFIVL